MKILITGNKGFIGKYLTNKLSRHEILGYDKGDSFPDEKVDLVIHLAANVNAYSSYSNPREAIENVNVLFETLEWMRKTGTNKILFASSREIYSMENPYGWSKSAGETLIKTYVKCYDFGAVCARIANVYGTGNLSHRFIENTIERAKKNEEIIIYGGKEKILNFIHVSDCVTWLQELAYEVQPEMFVVHDVIGNMSVKLYDLAEKIIELTNSKSKIVIAPNRRGETLQFIAGSERELISLEEGIKSEL